MKLEFYVEVFTKGAWERHGDFYPSKRAAQRYLVSLGKLGITRARIVGLYPKGAK